MNLITMTGSPTIFCDECLAKVERARRIVTNSGTMDLCEEKCFPQLRALLLGRRPRSLTARVETALALLTAADTHGVDESQLRRAIGTYATNVIKSLSAQGFARRASDGCWEITTAGRRAYHRRGRARPEARP